MFDALRDASRRRLLVCLLEHNPQDDSVKVPEDVHTDETDLSALQTEFVHRHLPKLEAMGYIRWDPDRHEVVKGPAFDEVRPLLELIENHADELPDGWV
jgi:hypothetical protein